jgi:hypothetical protein
MIGPMKDEILKVVPVISKPKNTPAVENSAGRENGHWCGEAAELSN